MSTIIRWDQARWDITYSFDALSSFLDTMEAQLEEVRRLEGARLQAVYDSFKPKDQDDYAFFMADYDDEVQAQKHRLDVMFPRILRYSLATQLFMLIETNFDAVCDEITKRRKLRLRSRDFRGPLFDRVKLFMDAAATLPLVYDKSWQELTKLQKVRDCIAHVGGKIEESRDREYGQHRVYHVSGCASFLCCLGVGEASSMAVAPFGACGLAGACRSVAALFCGRTGLWQTRWRIFWQG